MGAFKQNEIVVVSDGIARKNYFYAYTGELLGMCSFLTQNLSVVDDIYSLQNMGIPVDYVLTDTELILYFPDGDKAHVAGITSCIAYNPDCNIGIYLDAQDKMVIIDYNLQKELFRSAASVQ
jgi:hypothetical protein